VIRALKYPLVLAVATLAGCDDRPRQTPSEGVLGQMQAQPSTNIARAQPPDLSETHGQETGRVLPRITLTCFQTELSPAVLFHTDERSISFFTGLEESNRAAPAHVGFSTRSGPRAFKSGERLDTAQMEENWVMAWFAGARGWTNGDVPWVIYLQRKPRSMHPDTNGLHFQFNGPAGHIALVPLYGTYTCPASDTQKAVEFGGKKVQTWEWSKVLHREPLMRVRYWASALREFPLDCEETFSVDRSTDTLRLRQSLRYLPIADDWQTRALKLNPVSPTLALASRDPALPVKFDRTVMDLEMPTVFGPYMAAEGDRAVEIAFHVLEEVNAGSSDIPARAPLSRERGTWADWAPRSDARETCILAAREAYRANRADDYNYNSYLFTRALVHHHYTNRFDHYARTLQAGKRPDLPLPEPRGNLQRLIPAGPPSPFVFGVQREVAGPHTLLLQEIKALDGKWPEILLRQSTSTNDALSFGRVKVPGAPPEKNLKEWHSPMTERVIVFR
jgi:hypothetical protein